tara:strand:+ start:11530 stop:12114 length:585 start_codon:yes stop_codon:yes gene_type:complete
MNFIDILNQSLEQDQATYKNVVDINKNNQIEFQKYNSETCDQSSCCITMVDFNENDIVAVLPCKHCFNKEALIKWVTEESATCPICRFELESTEVSANGEEKQPENEEENDSPNPNNIRNNLIDALNLDQVSAYQNIVDNLSTNNNTVISRNTILELIRMLDLHISNTLDTIENSITDRDADAELQQAILNSLN